MLLVLICGKLSLVDSLMGSNRMHNRSVQFRRQENIFQLTDRLTQTQTRTVQLAPMLAAVAFLALGLALLDEYWKTMTGPIGLTCTTDSIASCGPQPMKIHGE